MKKILLFSFSVFFCVVSLFAQDNESAKMDYLLNAVDILSKINNNILVPEDTIRNEDGVPKTIHYLILSWAEGAGLKKTIRCGLDFSAPSKGFFNVDYPNEAIFSLNSVEKSVGGYSSFRFNSLDFEIKQYNSSRKIAEVRHGLRRIVKNTHAEEGGIISYGTENNEVHYDGFEIISTANPKDRRIRQEKGRLPNRVMNYKAYSKEGTDVFEYSSFYLSTDKSSLGKRKQEKYFKYWLNRSGEQLTLKKEEFTSSGDLQKYTVFEYLNYSLVKSETFDANNTLVEKAVYTYGQNGFPKTLEEYRTNTNEIRLTSTYEFFYEEIESNSNEGKYPYRQWEIRTDYNEDGSPRMQQKNQGRQIRRYFNNGQWDAWEAPLY
jgi:hypothetical protein